MTVITSIASRINVSPGVTSADAVEQHHVVLAGEALVAGGA